MALRHDFDIRGMGDAIDEIFGDVVVEALAAHDDGHLAGVTGKMQRGLRGGIAGADDHDMLVAAKLGFACAGAVIDAGAEQPVLVGQAKTAILDPRGADRDAGNDPGAVVEVDHAPAGGELAAHAGAVNQDLGPELRGLLARTLGELGAADPIRKTEIVLDLRAGAGLAADGEAFDEHGLQPLGGAIDRGAQPGRAGAVDGEVVLGAGGMAEPAELLSDLPHGGTLHPCPVLKDADRQTRVIEALDAQLGAGLLVACQARPIRRARRSAGGNRGWHRPEASHVSHKRGQREEFA